MPDLKDARQELGQALDEAGALPRWEDVTFDGAPGFNLQRIRVEHGWIYGVNRCPQVFVPGVAISCNERISEKLAALALALLEKQVKDNEWLRAELAKARGEMKP